MGGWRRARGWLIVLTLLLNACDAPVLRPPKRAPRTGAERVLVVINARSAASDSVGRYYIMRRGIDSTHVVRLALPDDDEIGDIAFQTDIVSPVRAAIEALPVRIDLSYSPPVSRSVSRARMATASTHCSRG